MIEDIYCLRTDGGELGDAQLFRFVLPWEVGGDTGDAAATIENTHRTA